MQSFVNDPLTIAISGKICLHIFSYSEANTSELLKQYISIIHAYLGVY